MAILANGALLLEGTPAETLDQLRGKIWTKVVKTDDELKAIEGQYKVLSTHLVSGLHELRIYSETDPAEGFRPVDSGLEDVYFLTLSRHSRN